MPSRRGGTFSVSKMGFFPLANTLLRGWTEDAFGWRRRKSTCEKWKNMEQKKLDIVSLIISVMNLIVAIVCLAADLSSAKKEKEE